MVGLYIPRKRRYGFLDWQQIVDAGHHLVEEPDATTITLGKDIQPDVAPSQTIFFLHEPPLEAQYRQCYHPDWTKDFPMVFSHGKAANNCMPITHHPLYFWKPRPPVKRPYDTLHHRLAFFGRPAYELTDTRIDQPWMKPCHSLYPMRRQMVTDLVEHPHFLLFGEGWPSASQCLGSPGRRNGDFRTSKVETIHAHQIDFLICLENCIMEGYCTEKLWDAFAAGVVPIYLGMPDIEQYVPSDCFVDGRLFFDAATSHFSVPELLSYLAGIDARRYRTMVEKGQAFLAQALKKRDCNSAYLTGNLLKVLAAIEARKEACHEYS